ncbi:MAG: hypothetical protein JO033_08085 [Acidobacteriaceae bacterium]|nr:hypothetical protein [Acidobacteriaceae bacterium]MBV9503023.1 hypothetical protein [Acidobacteriaceae bacterium]
MDIAGAICFGAVIGWITYFTMRYKKDHTISDISGIVGAIGGAAVLALFTRESQLFSWYAVGLAIGFFGYVVVLLLIGLYSRQLTLSDLLDGSKTKNPFMGG